LNFVEDVNGKTSKKMISKASDSTSYSRSINND